MTATNVRIAFEEDVERINQSGESFVFRAGEVLCGELELKPVAGPLEVRPVSGPHPAWCELDFKFEYRGQLYRHRSLFTAGRFRFSEGERVTEDRPGFTPNAGPFHFVHDSRDNVTYRLDSGEERKVRLKYMGATFRLMLLPQTVAVHCRHFHLDTGGYCEIYYEIPLSRLIFLNATKLCHDSHGKVEDADICGEPFTIIEPV